MAERLADIEARITSVRQLSSVIGAMRGIAAVRLREAEERLAGIRAHAQTVGEAIGQALRLMAGQAGGGQGGGAQLTLVLCGEHGFTGRYDEMLLDAALAEGAGDVLVVGDHGLAKADERHIAVWQGMAMAAHAEEVPALAARLADALYARLVAGDIVRVRLIHAAIGPGAGNPIARKTLLPFDFARFGPQLAGHAAGPPPLINLAPAQLLARLSEEYVFAQLCEALMLAYAAENAARMRAMIGAKSNVETKLAGLSAAACRLRQDAITSEITELAAAAQAL